ncbi:MAG: GNAT family protein [Bryobacteraceae bacterium]|jgi:ribosomal-protein-serine acetyltransferase
MFRRAVAPGIEMKQFEPGDAEMVFTVVDRNRAHLRQWLPWVDRTHSPEDIRQFIFRVQAQLEAGQGPNAGVWVNGVFAGNVGCHPINWPNRNCSLGYWIDAAQQGKGVITRCCAAMLDYLFDEMRLNRAEIRCGTRNTRSCAIPERLGFTREGVLRQGEWVNDRWVDLVVWGMLEEEWRAAAPSRAARRLRR